MSSSIEPSEIVDGVPVLKPSYEQFRDFQKFIQIINKLGNESGIVKVVPPREWVQLLETSLSLMGSLQSVKFGDFVRQRVSSCVDGVYLLEEEKVYTSLSTSLENTVVSRSGKEEEEEEGQSVYYSINQWKNLANSLPVVRNDNSDEAVRNSERRKLNFLEQDYWENLSKKGNNSRSTGLCGIDTTTSLFPASLRSWNISRLPTNISDYLNTTNPNNNSSKLVAGLWTSTIPCTTQQPNDPCSISYIHLGAPKQWYVVPKVDSTLFDKFIRPRLLTTTASPLLETQQFVVSPATLEANGIRVNKITQFPNEFILTFPCACYEAFDYGYNIAETAHFSSSVDDWTPRLPQGTTSVGEIIPDINKSWDRDSNSTYTPLPSLPNLFSNQNVSLRSTSPAFGQSSTLLGVGSGSGSGGGTNTNLNVYPATDSTHNMGQPQQQDFQQLSRVSSPLLSKMMDLSNIIEPTLDNSNLKFQTRRRYGSPKSLRLDDNPLDTTLRRPLSRSGTGPMVLPQKFGTTTTTTTTTTGVAPNSSSIGAASTTATVGSATNNNNNNNSNNTAGNFGSAANSASQTPTLVPLALRTCTVPSAALFDYNDDNLLALSLTSMANSSHSSPRPWKPTLNSPIDNTLNSIDSNRSYSASNVSRANSNTGSNLPYRFTGTLDRRIGQINLNNSNNNNNNNIGVSNVNRPSSPLMHVQSSDSNSNPAYILPFLKRVKSSNVVTLNVSRETSRSPVPMASTDTNQVPSAVTSGMSTAPQTTGMNQYSYMSKFPQPEESKPLQGRGQSQSQLQQPSIPELGYNNSFDLGPLPINKKPRLQTRVLSSPSALSVLAMTSSPLINEAELGPMPTSADMRSLTNPFPLVGLKGVPTAPSQQQTGPHFHSPPSEMATLALRNSQLGQQKQEQGQEQRLHNRETLGETLDGEGQGKNRDPGVTNRSGRVYICQECKRHFSSGHHLTRHRKSVHSEEKPFSCPKCGKKFKRRDHVLQHLNKKIPCITGADNAPVVPRLHTHAQTSGTTSPSSAPSPSPSAAATTTATGGSKGLFLMHLNSGKEGYTRS